MTCRTDAQLRVRLPAALKQWIAEEAAKHGASMNSEIVRALVEQKERLERSQSRRVAKAAQ